MSNTVDLSLVLERINDVLVGQRDIRDRLARVEARLMNTATSSQFLALAETLSQFDNRLSILDARVAVIEARLEH